MAVNKFDPKLFFQRTDNVTLYVPASEVFGLFKRSLDLPGSWAALVTRSTGDQTVVPAGGAVESADAEDVLFVRVTPVDVELEEEDIATRDGFQCRADLRLRLSLIPERGELLSFQKSVVGSHRVVQAAGIARYLQPIIRSVLLRLASEQDAASLVDAGSTEAISAALAEAVEAPCFAAGLTLEGRPTARFDSKTVRQVQQAREVTARRRGEHDAARQLQEAIDRAQAEHLDHLASLLTRLNDLAAGSPEVELPELIRTFSEQQRGELYEALFASEVTASQTQWLVVAAGDELLFFDASDLGTPARRLTISGEAGPVRSIQTLHTEKGRPILLLGAATGVYRLPVDRAEPDLTLEVAGSPPVRGGFNAVASLDDRVFATHSELGLFEWNVNEPGTSRARLESMTRGATAVRNVQCFEGDLYCSIDDRVIRFPADESADRPASIHTGSQAMIAALCATTDGVFAGNADGDVLYWSKGRDTDPELFHRGSHRAAESVWLLSSQGVRRLVFTDTSLHVHARVLGDNFTCRYEAGGQTLRRVEVAPDLIVATNDLRDRLFCWTPGRPNQPTATVAVSRMCSRSVQDVCLVPKT